MKYKAKRNYTIKVNGDKYETGSLIRFLRHVRTIKWEKPKISVYVKVYYGRKEDVTGKMVGFLNDGTYDNYKDFKLALDAFLE